MAHYNLAEVNVSTVALESLLDQTPGPLAHTDMKGGEGILSSGTCCRPSRSLSMW